MKQGQFSQEQIVAILQQAEKPDQTTQAICREHGITQTTFYRRRKKYGGMSVPEAHRLKELEKENARLKRLLAERDLAIDALPEYPAKKVTTRPEKQQVPAFLQQKGLSERFACRLLKI